MQTLIDITGNTYNFLKVIGFSHIGNRRRSYWKCECQKCGKIIVIRKDAFAYKYSKTKSCGCYKKEVDKLNADRKDKYTGKFIHI